MEYLLDKWKSILTKAANFSGWDIKNYRNEAEQVDEIVKDVLEKLDIALLDITDFPVGLESRVQDMIEFIENQSSKVCKLGIWGMGGSGKTTAAKAIYNKIHRKFKDRSFIENIREVCEKDNRGCINLQEQLLADILKTNVKVPSISRGTAMIKRRLGLRNMLFVFDDVCNFEQLKSLCVTDKWIGHGSVIIITTRDVRILHSLQVNGIYEMKGMDDTESLELFSWHAFREASPGENFSELSRNVVAYCGGLPLALEILGSYLFGRTKQEWTSVLSKLASIPNEQLQEKLKISYDGLDDMEKKIFLDICCFFIGKGRAYVTVILNGCEFHPEIGITILIERSLIKVEKNNKLTMHDLLRDMGREIVRQSSLEKPEMRSRLWAHEDVRHLLANKTGTIAIEGLALKFQGNRLCFDTKAFEKMKKLRLFQLDHVQLVGDYEYLPKQLRWLYWKGFPLKHLPDNFHQENVVAIDIKYSNIKQVWKMPLLMEKLKFLNLSHSKQLASTPDFSKLPNLEKLILKDCPRLSNVDQSIGDLSKLIVMNLKDCTSISNLPKRIYQLKSLQTLILSGCSKIDKLEEGLMCLESFTTLIAEGTAIKDMPRSIVQSKSIGYISLCGYEGLTRDIFPSLIWSWMSPTMNLVSCIPSSGSMSSSLVSLNAQDTSLGDKSPIIGSLSKLRCLWVQCKTEIQLSQVLKSIMNDTYSEANVSDLATSYASTSQILEHPSRSLLIGMGSHCQVLNALRERRSKGLTTNGSTDFFLPNNDNIPYCISHTGEGNSVLFKVPHISDWFMKGMVLSVVYSWTAVKTVDNCLISIFIVNHTKCTIQIYKQDTAKSFNDEDWQGILSNLGFDDKVQICVAFGHGLTVKWTAVYLIYDTSVNMEKEPLSNPKKKLREDL
ncbi:hypothetical protein RJT34_21987 [Clitoria ternatea]|uniref:TMV resistance protein N n=1 Tax=Clitoria ternatea TaxID=43366 RepID=A0AAN9IUY6_CLITE